METVKYKLDKELVDFIIEETTENAKEYNEDIKHYINENTILVIDRLNYHRNEIFKILDVEKHQDFIAEFLNEISQSFNKEKQLDIIMQVIYKLLDYKTKPTK